MSANWVKTSTFSLRMGRLSAVDAARPACDRCAGSQSPARAAGSPSAAGVSLEVAPAGRGLNSAGLHPLEASLVLCGRSRTLLRLAFDRPIGRTAALRVVPARRPFELLPTLWPSSTRCRCRLRQPAPRRSYVTSSESASSSSTPGSSISASCVPMGSGRPFSSAYMKTKLRSTWRSSDWMKALPAALQPLEQAGAAEAHQPLARPRQVIEHLRSSAVGQLVGDCSRDSCPSP